MGDIFKEQLVSVKKSSKDTLNQALIIIGAILLIIIAFIFGGMFIGPIAILAVLWGAWFLMGKLKKEYEYSLTNNELDIDVIFNKERRKKIMVIDMKKIHVMASIKDEKKQDELARAQKVMDFSNGEHTEDTYAIVCEKDGGLVKVLLTPNQEILNLMYRQAPNKVFKQRAF
ncbi:MAG: hypothetical protein AB9856_11475 [Cellulosilyticaceae bacterium]